MQLEIWGERWLLMGRPKVGKSTLAASFPKPLCLNLDGAGNKYVFIGADKIDVYTYEDCLKALETAKKRPNWETLILDTVDKFVTFLNRFVSRTCNVPTIADVGRGKGYAKQSALFKQFLEDFWAVAEARNSLCASIIVAHSKKGDDGQTLTIRDRLQGYLQGSVNNIAYCAKSHGESKQMEFSADLSGSDSIEAGCRNPTLQAAGVIPSSFKAILALFSPTDANMEKAYDWLSRKGGVDRDAFTSICNDDGKTTNIEKYEYIRGLRKNSNMLTALMSRITERKLA